MICLRETKIALLSDYEGLLSHAEVGEDIVKGFLRGDGSASDFSKDVEGLPKIFTEDIATELHLQAVEDPLDGFVGSDKGIVMTGICYDDIGV